MRIVRNLILILCLSACVWMINAEAKECAQHLSETPKIYGMIGRSDTYTVKLVAHNFARHYLNGTRITADEIEYVLNYLSNKQVLSSQEAMLGIRLVEELVMMSDEIGISNSEYILSNHIKFRIRLYEIKDEFFEKHLKDAESLANKYVGLYPDSEKARAYLKKIQTLMKYFPSNL